MRWRRALLTGTGLGLLAWGIVDARLIFGAVPGRLTLLFDGSCDFCTANARRIRAFDRHGRVTVLPFQKPDLPDSLGLTYSQCEQAVWAVTPDGAAYRSAQATNLVLAVILGSPLPLWIYAIPGLRQLQERAYVWLDANRTRLAGVTPHCEQYPEDCGQPGAHESAKPLTSV